MFLDHSIHLFPAGWILEISILNCNGQRLSLLVCAVALKYTWITPQQMNHSENFWFTLLQSKQENKC